MFSNLGLSNLGSSTLAACNAADAAGSASAAGDWREMRASRGSMALSPLIDRLVEALRCLPGVGPKSAQRMTFHLLERNREAALELARAIEEAVAAVGRCESCRMLSEQALCRICASPRRDSRTLCVVETPADMAAIDTSTGYQGMFFVLMGHLSPLDGIGPAELGLDQLERRLDGGGIAEVILATSSTVEGEATAHYLAELVRERGLRATRIAQGVPMGGELEFVDGGTLARAMMARRDAI